MIIFIMFILLIYLFIRNNELKRDIKILKNRFNSNNFCPNCGFNLNRGIVNNNIVDNYSNNNINKNTYRDIVYNKSNKKDIKNSLILISGSILIILSALIFLTSSWNYTNNMLKITIIFLMLVVFFGCSIISKKIFKLDKASKAFYYIALAYIPIFLLSISLFSLFGKYLSIFGLGRYIYLTISAILVSIIYYYSAIKNNNNVIAVFSFIFLIFSIIFFGLIFSNNIYILISLLLVFSLVLMILYLNKIYYYSKYLVIRIINILLMTLTSILLLIQLDRLNLSIFNVIALTLLFINLYFNLVKINNKESIYNYLYPLMTIYLGYLITSLSNNYLIIELGLITVFLSLYLYEYFKLDKINFSTHLEVLISFLILYFRTIFIEIDLLIYNDIYLSSGILLGIYLGLNIFNYLITTNYKKIQEYLISILLVIINLHILKNLDFKLTSLIINYLMLIIITSLSFKNNNSFKKSLYLVSLIAFIIFTIPSLLSARKYFISILYGLYSLVMLYKGTKNNIWWNRILSYIYSNIFIYQLLSIINIKIIPIITLTIFISTLLLMLIPNLKTIYEKYYLLISYIFSFILLLFLSTFIGFILFIILLGLFIVYLIRYNMSEKYLYIPLLTIMPYLYFSDILMFNNINYMYLISIILISVFNFLIYLYNKNTYIFLAYLYILFHLSNLEEFKYIGLSLVLITTFITYLKKNNKLKDLFLSVIYIGLFVLYNFIIYDLKIDYITTINIISYILLLILFTRSILNKYINWYKVIEYLGLIIINIVSINIYTSMRDAIIYLLFLTLIVIISYIYKLGPLLLVSLSFIIINTFLLTKSFWLSISIYIYVLLIGSILIGFAIYNEVNDNKNTLKNKLKNFKDDLDL